MNKGGWIKLHRKMLDWEWYSDPNTKIVFLHLLLTANSSKDSIYCKGGYEVKTGEVATSVQKIADACGLTHRQTRTALSHLLATKEVTNRKHGQISIISIENYSDYQQTDKQSDKQYDKQSDKHPNKQEDKKIRSATDNAVSTAYPRTRSGLPRLMKKKKEVSENEQ